ncbi:ImmA/IrrE family metallo-endopeptidase [Mycolicibacterium fortuitum]|uniref:ImmA/IrrE family metallo-endopeptidase n=1 Tax=Mycolicibacterium fortuitum TaxID=1766 RepID=UPI00148F4AC2|nr:ImmA/IrrE family metallo-endopeptidase [Mycolicibacterium fortuitum]
MGALNIGERVRECIDALTPPRTQKDIAAAVDMRPDQLSRSLSGDRAFSSIEIAMLADELDQDVHWLITGVRDPMRRELAARHEFDPATGRYDTPNWDRDQGVLANIELAYRQAYAPEGRRAAPPDVPKDPAELRAWLGEGFVRTFIDEVESRLSIDVIRLQDISHSYTMRLGGHIVIVIPASGSWFYENYSLGHELGHLASNSLEFGAASDARNGSSERAANIYSADLLLPADVVRGQDWTAITYDEFAKFLWTHGVSTPALRNRISTLISPGKISSAVSQWLRMSTFDVLNGCAADLDGDGQIAAHAVAARQMAAAQRRFPTTLVEAHLNRVSSGQGHPDTLAWMLGVQRVFVEDTGFSEFETADGTPFSDHSTVSSDRLSKLLGI